jgi:hypothetical protein
MMVYLLSGVLSYWDLESGNETNHFEVPSNLSSPIVFGNNRYLAGVDSNGLAVLDAVSGNLLARNDTIPAEALLCAAGDEFFCLVSGGDYAGIYRFAVDRGGRLTGRGRFPLPANSEDGMSSGDAGASVIAANAVPGGGIVLGTKSGEVILINQYGQAQTMSVSVQTRIFETAASGKTIAFLAENNTIGFLPLDYTSLSAGGIIKTEKDSRYTRISPYAEETGEAGRFIFWQAENASLQSVIKSAEGEPLLLGGISFRFPVRSVSSAGGKILFLDSAGNLSAILPQGGASANRPFSFFSVGLMDAAFIDKDNIIAARSAVSGNSPFLMININTGETVPLPYPSDAGVMVYRGASGSIYTAAVEQDSAGIKTSILRLNTASPAQSLRLVDLQEEDIQFSLAESQGRLAATIGGEGAAIYSAGAIQKFERSPGLPVRLISGGPYFISLDSEGSICWHESRAGKLLAIFRLYKRHWELHTTHGSINGSW